MIAHRRLCPEERVLRARHADSGASPGFQGAGTSYADVRLCVCVFVSVSPRWQVCARILTIMRIQCDGFNQKLDVLINGK